MNNYGTQINSESVEMNLRFMTSLSGFKGAGTQMGPFTGFPSSDPNSTTRRSEKSSTGCCLFFGLLVSSPCRCPVAHFECAQKIQIFPVIWRSGVWLQRRWCVAAECLNYVKENDLGNTYRIFQWWGRIIENVNSNCLKFPTRKSIENVKNFRLKVPYWDFV